MRRGTLRLSFEVARHIRAGHPWIYREALERRVLRAEPGEPVELVDPDGEFIARGIVDGESAIAVRVVSRNPKETIDGAAFARRISSAVAVRRRLLDWQAHQCIRLVNGENDEIPAVHIDRYGDYILIQIYSPACERYLDAIAAALEAEAQPKAIYIQRRYKPLSGNAPPRGAELMRGNAAPVDIEVREGDLVFICDVTAPLSTGLFGDLRLGREAIRDRAAGKRVLNLFSYTGAISVYAARGGASEVVAVDVAAKAHARARRNFTANGFDEDVCEHITGDVFKVLAKMSERDRRFDLIVLDPPAFASGSRGGKPWSASRDYGELVAASLEVLEPGGLLAAASSTHKLSLPDYEAALSQGAGRARRTIRIVERAGLPPDYAIRPGFGEANYLKFTISTCD